MIGKVEKINVENGYIKISNVLYKFNHPYKKVDGTNVPYGASSMMVRGGELLFKEGDEVDFTPANDGELKFLKYIGKPKGNPHQRSFGNKSNEMLIYRQHAEKVIGSFVTEIVCKMDVFPETVTKPMIDEFVNLVSYGAEKMVDEVLKSKVMK